MIRRVLAAAAAGALYLTAAPAALAAPADPLPRGASLGVATAPTPAETATRLGAGRTGAFIQSVQPGQTAAAIGVQPGDVVLVMNGQTLASSADLVAGIRRLRAGDAVSLRVWRDGAERDLSGPALGRPKESYEGGVTTYGATPFRGGHLRDILVMPEGKPDAPVVFLIQGFTCASIDYADPNDAHRMLTQALVRRGIGVYRVEKPGVGDSRGTPRCEEIDFDVELAGFQAGYDHLVNDLHVPLSRVFMLGHSMGGLQAPLLAARRSPRGVAVYGTVLRNWADYHFDLVRVQSSLFGSPDPAAFFELSEEMRELFRKFYFERKSFAALAAESPEQDQLLRQVLAWPGGDTLYSRHSDFWHDLAHLPLAAAWRDTRSRVLSLYGESDLVALNGEDHLMIEVIVNAYRPGTARYVGLPRVDHGMTRSGAPEEIRAQTLTAGGRRPPLAPAPFAPEVASTLADWIDETMKLPPVS